MNNSSDLSTKLGTTSATPITDSLLANKPPGTQVDMGTIAVENGFALGIATAVPFNHAVKLMKCSPPFEQNGEQWPWKVERLERSIDRKTDLRVVNSIYVKTESEAHMACAIWRNEINEHVAKQIAAEKAAKLRKPSINEIDLAEARLKVLREQFPDTFKAMDVLKVASPEAHAAALEAVFVAHAVDLVRLHKPNELSDVLPFHLPLNQLSFIEEIAKAKKAQSPYDPVDAEIAANWFAAGYDKMTLGEYTEAINAKTGSSLSPEAMLKRRYRKLGLMTEN